MSNVSQFKSNINMLSYGVIEKINCFKRNFSENIQASTADFLVKFLTAELSCEVSNLFRSIILKKMSYIIKFG